MWNFFDCYCYLKGNFWRKKWYQFEGQFCFGFNVINNKYITRKLTVLILFGRFFVNVVLQSLKQHNPGTTGSLQSWKEFTSFLFHIDKKRIMQKELLEACKATHVLHENAIVSWTKILHTYTCNFNITQQSWLQLLIISFN